MRSLLVILCACATSAFAQSPELQELSAQPLFSVQQAPLELMCIRHRDNAIYIEPCAPHGEYVTVEELNRRLQALPPVEVGPTVVMNDITAQ